MLSDLDARAVAAAGTTEPTCAASGQPLTRAQHALALARKLAATSQGALADTQQRQSDAAQLAAVKLRIDLLKPHPRQAEIFPSVPEEQIKALAASIKESGLDHPIEVVPDCSGYTIVAGHCRVEAVRRLGWTEIDAIIRNDLAEQGPLAAEFYMINDNFLRRQLRPLQRAQCALSLKELAMQRQCDDQPLDHIAKAVIRQTPSTREEIGGLLGICGREVSRLIRVLDTPPEVQAAFDAGKLSLVLADKIAGLDEAKQQAVAVAIRKGTDAVTGCRGPHVQGSRRTSFSAPAEPCRFSRSSTPSAKKAVLYSRKDSRRWQIQHDRSVVF